MLPAAGPLPTVVLHPLVPPVPLDEIGRQPNRSVNQMWTVAARTETAADSHSPVRNSHDPGDRCPARRRQRPPAKQPKIILQDKTSQVTMARANGRMRPSTRSGDAHLSPSRPRPLVVVGLAMGRSPPRRFVVAVAPSALHSVDRHLDQPLDETLHGEWRREQMDKAEEGVMRLEREGSDLAGDWFGSGTGKRKWRCLCLGTTNRVVYAATRR
jgi:hypothetical protein